MALPPVREIALVGETFAYHEELYSRAAGRYRIPTRRALHNGGNAKAAEYVRSRWKLELLRRTIDDAFTEFDAVFCPPGEERPARSTPP